MKPIAAKIAKSVPSNTPVTPIPKTAAEAKENGVVAVKRATNFKQSRDVRENRSERQAKNTPPTSIKKGK